MKKIIAVLGIALLTLPPEKKYSVSLSFPAWSDRYQMIEFTKNVLKSSDAPAKIVLPLLDSLSKFQNEINDQIRVQVDTTKKK